MNRIACVSRDTAIDWTKKRESERGLRGRKYNKRSQEHTNSWFDRFHSLASLLSRCEMDSHRRENYSQNDTKVSRSVLSLPRPLLLPLSYDLITFERVEVCIERERAEKASRSSLKETVWYNSDRDLSKLGSGRRKRNDIVNILRCSFISIF